MLKGKVEDGWAVVARGLEDMDQFHLGLKGYRHLANQVHHGICEDIEVDGNQDLPDGLHGCSSGRWALQHQGRKDSTENSHSISGIKTEGLEQTLFVWWDFLPWP